jgi:outer membrane protein assembly factor BamB
VRWRVALAPGARLRRGAVAGGLAAVVLGGAYPLEQAVPYELALVETETGVVRWRVPLEHGLTSQVDVLIDGARVYVEKPHSWPLPAIRITAYDVNDGGERWTYATGEPPLGDWPAAAIDGGTLVLGYKAEGLRLLAAATGAELRRWPLPLTLSAVGIAASGGVAYVARARDASAFRYGNDLGRAMVVALDLASGRERWRWDGDLFVDSPFALARDSLTFVSDGGVITTLDRATGRALWRWGSAGPDKLFARRDPTGDGAPIAVGNLLLTGCRPAHVEHVTIRGTVTVDGRPKSGVTIYAADQSTKTDARGQYRIETDLAGGGVIVSAEDLDIPISNEGRQDGGVNDPVIVRLDGRGSYRADIAAISFDDRG